MATISKKPKSFGELAVVLCLRKRLLIRLRFFVFGTCLEEDGEKEIEKAGPVIHAGLPIHLMENLNSQLEVIIKKHVAAAVTEAADLQKTHIMHAFGLNGASNGAAAVAAPVKVAAKPAAKSTKVSAKKPVTKKVAKTAGKTAAKAAKKGAKRTKEEIDASKGVKRDPAVLQKLMDSIHKYVAAHQTGKDGASVGVGIEVLSKSLKTASKDLTLPMKKLIKENKITTTGQKRATRYFAK